MDDTEMISFNLLEKDQFLQKNAFEALEAEAFGILSTSYKVVGCLTQVFWGIPRRFIRRRNMQCAQRMSKASCNDPAGSDLLKTNCQTLF